MKLLTYGIEWSCPAVTSYGEPFTAASISYHFGAFSGYTVTISGYTAYGRFAQATRDGWDHDDIPAAPAWLTVAADSMAAIREQVAEKDYQLLIEVVNPDDPKAVWIEDGQVA